MKIEHVTSEGQLAQLATLEAVCFPEESWSHAELSAFLAAPIREALLLAEQDAPVGYVIVTAFDGEVEIERLGIAPTCRGRGLGQTLLSGMCEMLHVERCILEVSAHNLPAKRLYARFGFETFNCRPGYYKGGADALMMEWKRKHE